LAIAALLSESDKPTTADSKKPEVHVPRIGGGPRLPSKKSK